MAAGTHAACLKTVVLKKVSMRTVLYQEEIEGSSIQVLPTGAFKHAVAEQRVSGMNLANTRTEGTACMILLPATW